MYNDFYIMITVKPRYYTTSTANTYTTIQVDLAYGMQYTYIYRTPISYDQALTLPLLLLLNTM